MDDDYDNDQSKDSDDVSSYNGKIMFASGAVLVVACIIVVLFHAFVRWFRYRNTNSNPSSPYNHHHQSHTRLRHVILIPGVPEGGGGGLDLRVLKLIPTFRYESKNKEKTTPSLECAVCLSEFEDGEMGRVLPDCSHRFHVGCIDVWLGTHSDCPICRAQVRTSDRVNICIDDRDVGVGDGAGRDETGHDPGSSVDQDRSPSSSSSSSLNTSSSDDRTVAVEQDRYHHGFWSDEN